MDSKHWKIIDKAFQSPRELFGIEPKSIKELHALGPEGDLPESQLVWLNDIGKRYGLVPWDSEQERQSHSRFKRSARSGALLPQWKRNNPKYNKNGSRKR